MSGLGSTSSGGAPWTPGRIDGLAQPVASAGSDRAVAGVAVSASQVKASTEAATQLAETTDALSGLLVDLIA